MDWKNLSDIEFYFIRHWRFSQSADARALLTREERHVYWDIIDGKLTSSVSEAVNNALKADARLKETEAEASRRNPISWIDRSDVIRFISAHIDCVKGDFYDGIDTKDCDPKPNLEARVWTWERMKAFLRPLSLPCEIELADHPNYHSLVISLFEDKEKTKPSQRRCLALFTALNSLVRNLERNRQLAEGTKPQECFYHNNRRVNNV